MSAQGAWRRALVVCAAVVLVDQVSKAIVRSSLALGDSVRLVLGFHLSNGENQGVAFGALGGGGALVLVVTLAALVLVLGWFALDPARRGLWLGAGLVAGGAIGNLADRVRTGAVTDFIDPPFWPAFNVADIAITVGAIVLIWVSLEGAGREHAGAGP